MRNDINDLKKLTLDLMQNGNSEEVQAENHQLIQKIYHDQNDTTHPVEVLQIPQQSSQDTYDFIETIEEDENLSLQRRKLK